MRQRGKYNPMIRLMQRIDNDAVSAGLLTPKMEINLFISPYLFSSNPKPNMIVCSFPFLSLDAPPGGSSNPFNPVASPVDFEYYDRASKDLRG